MAGKPLTPDQRQRLKAAGYNNAEIYAFERGQITGAMANKMDLLVNSQTPINDPATVVGGVPLRQGEYDNLVGGTPLVQGGYDALTPPTPIGGVPLKQGEYDSAMGIIGGTPLKQGGYDALTPPTVIGGVPLKQGEYDAGGIHSGPVGGTATKARGASASAGKTGISAADFRTLIKRGYKLSQLNELARTNPAQLQRLVNAAGNLTSNTGVSRAGNNYNFETIGGTASRAGSGGSALANLLTGSAAGQLVGKLVGKGQALADKLIPSGNGTRAPEKLGSGAAGGNSGVAGKMGAAGSGIPEFAPYSAPEIAYRDFTGQAQQQVGDIYAPRYAAIDSAMARARQNYDRSSAVTSGLYENLAKSTAQVAEDTRARYAQAAADQQQRTNDTANAVGQTYANNQQQEAGLLQQLGQQESAGILSNDTADSSWQQGQIQREGQAQLANNNAQSNAQQDYVRNVGAAQQTGGVVAQQDLMNQLSNINAGYEQDRFGLQGDQTAAALQLGQQLSERDFSAQQANAQMGLQAYGINNSNAQWQYEQRQAQLDRQQQAALQAQQMRAALTSAQQDQFNADRSYALDQAKFTTGLANDQANLALQQQKLQPQGYQQLGVNDQDPTSRTLAQITSAAGGDQATAKNYFDFVQQATNAFAASGLDATQIIGSQFSFVSEIGRQAQAKGLNPTLAQAAAAAVWQNLLKGK